MRNIKDKKLAFRQARIQSLTSLHSSKQFRESTSLIKPSKDTFQPLVPTLHFSKVQEQSTLTLAHVRYQRECRSQRNSLSPHCLSQSPINRSFEENQEKSKLTRDQTYQKYVKQTRNKSTSEHIVNIHTDRLRKGKARSTRVSPFAVRSEQEDKLPLISVRRVVKKSKHHLFRTTSYAGPLTHR